MSNFLQLCLNNRVGATDNTVLYTVGIRLQVFQAAKASGICFLLTAPTGGKQRAYEETMFYLNSKIGKRTSVKIRW